MILLLGINLLDYHMIESIEYQFHCYLRAYKYRRT